eukprot:777797-Rhodomonas_salina.1
MSLHVTRVASCRTTSTTIYVALLDKSSKLGPPPDGGVLKSTAYNQCIRCIKKGPGDWHNQSMPVTECEGCRAAARRQHRRSGAPPFWIERYC